MELLTESNCKDLIERFGGFHDSWVTKIEFRQSYVNQVCETTVEIEFNSWDWQSGKKEHNEFEVSFFLNNVQEYRLIGGADFFGIDQVGIQR